MRILQSPVTKGIITGLLMVSYALFLDAKKETADLRLQYFIYLLYAGGIVWTLVQARQNSSAGVNFMGLFGQGFRCFMIVTLIMVAFTFIFIKTHPEFAIQEAAYQKEQLIRKNENTPAEIEDLVAKAKKLYAVRYISASIFGYLIAGAAITAAASVFFIRRK